MQEKKANNKKAEKKDNKKTEIKEIKVKESKTEKTLKISSDELLAQALKTLMRK